MPANYFLNKFIYFSYVYTKDIHINHSNKITKKIKSKKKKKSCPKRAGKEN